VKRDQNIVGDQVTRLKSPQDRRRAAKLEPRYLVFYNSLPRLRALRGVARACLIGAITVLLQAGVIAAEGVPETKDLPAAFTKLSPTSIADLKAMEKHVETLTKKVSPTVVALEIGGASGSGVLISSNGFVLTAGHVADAPNREVHITFPDGKVVHGKTIGVVSDVDAGLLKITDPGTWPCAEMQEEKDPKPGDWVLALGHPGGFDAKRSLVTRLGRVIHLNGDDLQTDCTISPGDSGGPVFDMNGRIIAIHTYIRTSMSENYHVPVGSFVHDLKQLMKTAKTASTK
jgi:S1-C subfamily serine protease